jgi:putative transposase
LVYIIDDFNREVLTIALDSSMPASRVIGELDQLIEWRGKPENIRVDNGPEFISSKLKEWTEHNKINLMHIQPGKPTQNSLIERFNRTFREEVLDSFLFKSIKEIRSFAKAWMWIYNNERPHQGLNNLTPPPNAKQDNDDENQWKNLILKRS